jgi:hypothetical protein
MKRDPNFPAPIRKNGRLYWLRSEIEKYKADLICAARNIPPQTIEPRAVEEFVPSDIVAVELGVSRRTLGRRFGEAA